MTTRTHPTEATLRALVAQGFTHAQIGQTFGFTGRVVSQACHLLGIRAVMKGRPAPRARPTEAALRTLVAQGFTHAQIGQALGFHTSTISHACNDFGIPGRIGRPPTKEPKS